MISMFNLNKFLILAGFALSVVVLNSMTNPTQSSYAQNTQGIVISNANSSFVPLTNTDANQVRVNIKYTIDDDSLKNEKINAVMAVFAPNGTLIRTTSFPSGFTAESNGGVETLRTTIHDKSLRSVLTNVTFTDLTKTKSISNILSLTLDLKDTPTLASLLGNKP